MTGRHIVSIVLVLLTCTVIAVLIVPQVWPRQEADPAEAKFERTRDVMGDIQFALLESRDSVQRCLETMLVEDPSLLETAGLRASLIEFLTDAIWLYYGETDPSRYRAWRSATGAVIRRDAMRTNGRLRDLQTMLRYIDEASPDDLDLTRPIEELYDVMWSITRRANRGANRAIGMAAAPPGLACRWFIDDPGVTARPMLTVGIGDEAWYGGIAMSAFRWFEPNNPPNLPSIAVTVGVVFEFANGLKRPLLFTCIHRAAESRWDLTQVTMTNFPPEENLWPWHL
ncbi:MAG: hypothetical protein HRU76_15890 [Phycisphaeraceae bacterium]|nr:hypothetical protein [Phycisphaerales bacterium]QOJ18976.1 MAG: hypothetical protein HRU76_15890 [Phycisphaeraceae bacterium]